jgi:hypothetical protein
VSTTPVGPPGTFVGSDQIAVDDSVVAYSSGPLSNLQNQLVVRSRTTFDVLWSGPVGLAATPELIAGDRLYTLGGPVNAPVVQAWARDGCGAAVCDPLFTAPVPLPASFDSLSVQLLAASDDGHLLLHRAADQGAFFDSTIIALNTDGSPAWTFATGAEKLAVAGATVFTTGTDSGTSGIVGLDVATGAVDMVAAAPAVGGDRQMIVAGGLVYVEGADASGTKVDIFPTDCGQHTCSLLRAVDTGTGQDSFYGLSVSEGALFVAKAGPDGLQAFAPAN